jgi:hypothetical protein
LSTAKTVDYRWPADPPPRGPLSVRFVPFAADRRQFILVVVDVVLFVAERASERLLLLQLFFADAAASPRPPLPLTLLVRGRCASSGRG